MSQYYSWMIWFINLLSTCLGIQPICSYLTISQATNITYRHKNTYLSCMVTFNYKLFTWVIFLFYFIPQHICIHLQPHSYQNLFSLPFYDPFLGVDTPMLCKLIMTDGCPPTSTSQENLHKRFQVNAKVVVITGIDDTIGCKQWATCSIHLHHDLSPCHCDSAGNLAPKIKHTIFLLRVWWQTRVTDRGLSG